MPKNLPDRPSLTQLRRQAKDLLKQVRSGNQDALERVYQLFPRSKETGPGQQTGASFALNQAQLVIAREYGFSSWAKLKRHLEALASPGEVSHVALLAGVYDQISGSLPDGSPMISLITALAGALKESHQKRETWAFVVLSNCSPLLAGKSRAEVFDNELGLEESRESVARYFGFSTWKSIEDSEETAPDPRFEQAVDVVIDGDLEELSRLLAGDPSLVRRRSNWGHRSTLLHYVAANGVEIHRQKVPANAVDIARLLLETGAAPDALAETYGGGVNQTPLSLLVTSGHPHDRGLVEPLVALLAEFGANLDGVDHSGGPLRMALDFGYKETADALVQSGASITCLEVAAGVGASTELLKFLAAKPDQKQLDKSLYLAARNGRESCVEPLIQAGADLNAVGWFGAPALHWAAVGGYDGIVKTLVEGGSDPNLRDDRFHAHAAAWANEGGHPSIRDWLQEAGCLTSITEAAAFGQMELVEALLKRDPSIVNANEGRTALHEAAGRGNLAMTKFLLEHGADRSSSDARGLRPIDWARHARHEQIVSILED